jgi:hypothetical protein
MVKNIIFVHLTLVGLPCHPSTFVEGLRKTTEVLSLMSDLRRDNLTSESRESAATVAVQSIETLGIVFRKSQNIIVLCLLPTFR